MKALINLIFIFAFVLVVWAWMRPGNNPLEKANAEMRTMKGSIGSKVIYQKDTLMIVDYSWISDTYKLSNGVDVNKSLLPTIKIEK